MTFCKEKFNPENTEFDSFDTYEKAYQIIDNWDAIMMLAYDAFLGIEDFSMKSSNDGLHTEVVEDVKRDIDDFNVSNELDDTSVHKVLYLLRVCNLYLSLQSYHLNPYCC